LQIDYFFNLLRQQYDIPVGTEKEDYKGSFNINRQYMNSFYFFRKKD